MKKLNLAILFIVISIHTVNGFFFPRCRQTEISSKNKFRRFIQHANCTLFEGHRIFLSGLNWFSMKIQRKFNYIETILDRHQNTLRPTNVMKVTTSKPTTVISEKPAIIEEIPVTEKMKTTTETSTKINLEMDEKPVTIEEIPITEKPKTTTRPTTRISFEVSQKPDMSQEVMKTENPSINEIISGNENFPDDDEPNYEGLDHPIDIRMLPVNYYEQFLHTRSKRDENEDETESNTQEPIEDDNNGENEETTLGTSAFNLFFAPVKCRYGFVLVGGRCRRVEEWK
ncbi:CLUMA_CG001051, isoform A [Clunio marinus]|uniref:CLUMA_CG001051, isoform A n=1 Tax=Clunio marinus TaxID=568069 RepID=A0A1J1HLZ8_9DIPT|nr:CLUMA_CG001051, isoform A [Clunio marinus]